MTDAAQPIPAGPAHRSKSSLYSASSEMRSRNAAEKRFRAYGIFAVVVSILTLATMLWTIFSDGIGAFSQARIAFPVTLDETVLDPSGTRDPAEMATVSTIRYGRVLAASLVAEVERLGITVEGLTEEEIGEMISLEAASELRDFTLANPPLIGTVTEVDVLAMGRIDGYYKGRVTMDTAVRDGNVSPQMLLLADALEERGLLYSRFNWSIFTSADASPQRPEAAGLGVAIIGSAYLMLIVLVLSLPIGVAASIYLEEFAPKNKWTDLIEVNISNLAAVPSIVFGILALAIFINFMELPVSSSVVGGLALALMTLPTIIIATRASLKAVPPSIRDAALGVGASKMQTVFHHVLPLAMPGILTGTILGLATALGETAPLLLIGMVAFVDNYPSLPPEGLLDPATALPVQIYVWAGRDDPGFVERSAGAIIVLLGFLVIMNVGAILLRRRFERRW